MNTILAVNPRRVEHAFHAGIEVSGEWRASGDHLTLPVRITNQGSHYWPNGVGDTFPTGSVTVGAYRHAEAGRVELPRKPLPRPLSHGDSVDVHVRVPWADVEGATEVGIDLVREGISWFAEYGSTALVLALPAAD